MKGDISADLHAPAKRYSGVRAQQGRVLTDADFNAAMDVVDDTLEALVRSLICAAGTPDGGFQITAPIAADAMLADGSSQATLDFTIAPGSFVLGGRALVTRQARDFLGQADWIAQVLDPGALPPAPVDGRTDLVYLESIVQPVRAVEDREIQERALGSADTTTRLRPQLKVRVADGTVDECVVAMEGLRATLAGSGGTFSEDGTELLSNARLSVALQGPGEVADPCAPRSLSGYLGAENQTIRVMLTDTGFVWAYDHGEPLYRVQIDEDEVVFLTQPRDPVLYPGTDMVIEILPWDALLPNGEKAAAALGHRARLTGEYNPATGRISYDGTMPGDWQTWLNGLDPALEGRDDTPPRYFYARIWQAPAGGGTDQPTGAAVALAQTGIQLTFSGNGFAGDYWTVSVRPDAPELVVPWDLLDPAGSAPVGPRRFYAPLALLGWRADAEGTLSAEVDDCRNRFRRLCQIKGCCTYQVGDGRTTFGEFNTIQAAVDALPDEGGEICLLPGLHEGRVDLRGRRGITIHGCGRRTVVVPPDEGPTALFRIGGARDLILRDFSIRTPEALAVQATGPVSNVVLQALDILVTGAAISAVRADDLTIRASAIRSRLFPAALTPQDIAGLGPLVYLTGDDLTVADCTIQAERVQRAAETGQGDETDGTGEEVPVRVSGGRQPLERTNRIMRARTRFTEAEVLVAETAAPTNRVALGGLWIGGDSTRVRVHDNHITGGNGNGITLGSVQLTTEQGLQLSGPLVFGILVLDEGGCPQFNPPGSFRLPPGGSDNPNPGRVESEGPLTDLRIERNRIEELGASGITVGYWFVATEDGRDDAFDDIEIEDAVIQDNVIQRCMLLDLPSGLPVDFAFATGFGGIALASAQDLSVDNNDIRRCGPGRTSICGIYVRYGERLFIERNRIYDNGRPATLTDPLLVGNIGGIVLSHVEGRQEDIGAALRETPALTARGNTVVSPEGRALEVIGSGQMLIEGNALTAHGNNSLGLLLIAFQALASGQLEQGSYTTPGIQGQLRALLAQILGSCVAIMNTGVNPNMAIMLGGLTATSADPIGVTGQSARLAPAQGGALTGLPAQGMVMFNDNQVTFDAFTEASTLSLCSIGILSLDDVAMQDNQCTVDAFNDVVLINAVVLGLVSTRVQGNRFREIINLLFFLNEDPGDNPLLPISTLLSAMTYGIMNATEMNQGTHCFLRLGPLKPRLVDNPNNPDGLPVMDTNRSLIGGLSEASRGEGVCDGFFESSVEED